MYTKGAHASGTSGAFLCMIVIGLAASYLSAQENKVHWVDVCVCIIVLNYPNTEMEGTIQAIQLASGRS